MRAAIAVAILLGIALLVTALGPHRVGDYFTETDFYGGYAAGARALQGGHLDPARYGVVGPGYEVALAVVGFAVRDLLLAAELISVLSVTAGVALWALLVARRADPRLAFALTLFLATNGTLFRYGYSATTDALAWALQALGLFLLLARERPRDALLAGAVAAFAFLTRYSAVYLLPTGLVALLAGGTLQPRRARGAWLFAAGFAAPVVPWVLVSLANGGSLALQLHHNIAYDVFARAQGIPWDEYQRLLQPQFRTLWDVIARDPGAVARRELFNLWDHLRLDAQALLGPAVAATAAVGVVLAARDGTLRRLWPLWLAGAVAFLVLVPVFYSERYSLPLLPIYGTLAAAAFSSPRFAFALGKGKALWLKPALALIPLAFAAQASARLQARVMDQLPVEVLESARVLRAEARPGDRIIARKPHIAFHGGVEPLPFPFTTTLPELAAYARDQKARWLFFSWPEAEMRPDYFFLLDTSAVVPGLSVRNATSGHPAILYEIGPGFGAMPNWSSNDTLTAYHTSRARLMVNPREVRSLYTLGLIARARGQMSEARARFELALRLEPDDLPTVLALAEVYLRSNDAPRATQAYQRALALEPGNVSAQVGLGWSALVARQPADAARLWRGVIGATGDGATLRRMIELYRVVGDPVAEAEARAALGRLGGTP
jgi:tetratricopeptide (TPR) repeat protein